MWASGGASESLPGRPVEKGQCILPKKGEGMRETGAPPDRRMRDIEPARQAKRKKPAEALPGGQSRKRLGEHVLVQLLSSFAFFTLIVVTYSGRPVYAVEFETRTDDMRRDMEATASSFKKDRRFVPVPIPLSNPTIGSGLLLGLIYLHEKETDVSDAPTSTSGLGESLLF